MGDTINIPKESVAALFGFIFGLCLMGFVFMFIYERESQLTQKLTNGEIVEIDQKYGKPEKYQCKELDQ